MKKISLTILFLILIFVNNNSTAQNNSTDSLQNDGYILGTTLRQLDVDDLLIADIPLIEARIPLGTDFVQFKYGGQLMWGLSDFFVEWNYGAGLIVYPFAKYLGIHATGRVGSFFFDNISCTGAIGIHLDIPLDKNRIVSIGVESFYRNSRDLFDYVDFPGKKNQETINVDSQGIGISIGFRD